VERAWTSEESRLKEEHQADLQEIQERFNQNVAFAMAIPGKVAAVKAAKQEEMDKVLKEVTARADRHIQTGWNNYPMLMEYGRTQADKKTMKVDLDKEPKDHDSVQLRNDMRTYGML